MISRQPHSYILTIDALFHPASLELTPEEFSLLKDAKAKQLFGLGLEEKFDLVLENFQEYEMELIRFSMEHSIFPGKVIDILGSARHLLNRRLVNFLTTSRLYLDQILHELSCTYGKESHQYLQIKSATRREYDSVLGYRVIEALRNHVQHQALPIWGITLPMKREKINGECETKFSTLPYLVSEQFEGTKFKASVLQELINHQFEKGKIPISRFVREHTEALGRIHLELRELIEHDLYEADSRISSYLKKGQEEFGNSLGLSAMKLGAGAIAEDKIAILDRIALSRQYFEKKNTLMDSLSSRFVSSK